MYSPRLMPDAPYVCEKSIALVGLMGAGKSTVGRRLARRIGLPFADTDQEIEAAAGLSVAEIFERFGEDYFREGERRLIARLIDGPPKVIATGGGAFNEGTTRALLLAETVTIWLEADLATLAERVSRRDTRPLLRDRDPGELLAELATERERWYALAHVHVRGDAPSHEAVVGQILEALPG